MISPRRSSPLLSPRDQYRATQCVERTFRFFFFQLLCPAKQAPSEQADRLAAECLEEARWLLEVLRANPQVFTAGWRKFAKAGRIPAGKMKRFQAVIDGAGGLVPYLERNAQALTTVLEAGAVSADCVLQERSTATRVAAKQKVSNKACFAAGVGFGVTLALTPFIPAAIGGCVACGLFIIGNCMDDEEGTAKKLNNTAAADWPVTPYEIANATACMQRIILLEGMRESRSLEAADPRAGAELQANLQGELVRLAQSSFSVLAAVRDMAELQPKELYRAYSSVARGVAVEPSVAKAIHHRYPDSNAFALYIASSTVRLHRALAPDVAAAAITPARVVARKAKATGLNCAAAGAIVGIGAVAVVVSFGTAALALAFFGGVALGFGGSAAVGMGCFD